MPPHEPLRCALCHRTSPCAETQPQHPCTTDGYDGRRMPRPLRRARRRMLRPGKSDERRMQGPRR
eukprot:228096-Chlamydomonas_euryale.AAC.1